MDKIKIAASYSGGKDSALALQRAIKDGCCPVSLITTYNEEAGRTWFHGLPLGVLDRLSMALDIPILRVQTRAQDAYAIDFENALKQLSKKGVEACVFGDIDIQDHYDWCDSRCKNAGIKSMFPLWKGGRKDIVYEMLDAGFKTVITIVNTKMLSENFLGKTLTKELAEEIANEGADICGENGEYHSFVYDGPIFKSSIPFKFGGLVRNGDYSILPVC